MYFNYSYQNAFRARHTLGLDEITEDYSLVKLTYPETVTYISKESTAILHIIAFILLHFADTAF